MTVITPTQKRAILAQAVEQLGRPGETQRTVAARLGIGQSTLCTWLKETSASPPTEENVRYIETGPDGSIAAGSSPTKGSVPSPATVLAEHGIDIDDVEVVSVRASRWGNPDDPNFQLRVNAIRKADLLQQVTVSLPDEVFGVEEFSHGSVAFIGDQHIPYMSAAWESAVLSYLRAEQPQLIVFLGDLGDYSIISRHRTHPRFAAAVNETNTGVVEHIARVRRACPDSQIVLLKGNHDARIEYALQDYKPELYGIAPGALPGETEEIPALNFRRLWQLDKLGVELVDEDWKLGEYRVAPELSARHGYLTGNNSERKLLETHGRSQVHGHDHRGSVIYRTKHDPLDIRVAMSCGTGAQVKPDGLGYQPDPDWTPGIGVGHVWDDGMFVLNFAPFINNQLLLPGGMRFESQEA